MARPLLLLTHPTQSMSQAGLTMAALLLCGIALFICASHSRKWRRWNACYGSYNEGPVIQLNSDAMLSEDQEEVSVWQKNILMGEKCQLPDFSGVIIYNSDGNVVTPAKAPRALLTWK